jgi:peptidoglycan-associated lipoprotein
MKTHINNNLSYIKNKTIPLLLSSIAILTITGCSTKQQIVSFDSDNNKTKVNIISFNHDQQEKKQNNFLEEDLDYLSNYENNNQKDQIMIRGIDDNEFVNIDSTVNDSNNNFKEIELANQFKNVHFGFDEYTYSNDKQLEKEQQEAIIGNQKNGHKILAKEKNKQRYLKIEGNSDAFGSGEYNLALGLKRANFTKNEMIKKGLNKEFEAKIIIVSLGESNPKCNDNNEECYSKNRRSEVKLLESI